MSVWLRQSTATEIPFGPFLDSADGVTPKTALTITQPDIRLKKNGANWAQKNAAQTLLHEENGWYEIALDATDTATVGALVVAVNVATALPVWREFVVVPSSVYDALISATANLAANVTTAGAQAVRDVALSGAAAGSLGEALMVLQGVSAKSNMRIDNMVYNGTGFMTSCRLRVFASQAAAAASTAGGVGQGEIFTVTLTGTPDGTFTQLPSTVLGTRP